VARCGASRGAVQPGSEYAQIVDIRLTNTTRPSGTFWAADIKTDNDDNQARTDNDNQSFRF
jgi:hypothetical protein